MERTNSRSAGCRFFAPCWILRIVAAGQLRVYSDRGEPVPPDRVPDVAGKPTLTLTQVWGAWRRRRAGANGVGAGLALARARPPQPLTCTSDA